jgi:hypothetical protein
MSLNYINLTVATVILCSGCTKETKQTEAEQWTTSEIVITSEREYLNGYTDVEVWAIFSNEKNDY